MGCNTSKESVHPTDETTKENNDNQVKDVNNKEDCNNIEEAHSKEKESSHIVVNNLQEIKGESM